MRTLLIDNYDSYTYNLFQLIADVNGAVPTVIRNDAAEARRLDLADFDNIVISPGPGHPARPDDFGICTEVIRSTSIPLLGVCLGHQGIAAGERGVVTAAPAARHGHLTRIRHDGSDLFAGLPQDFVAVRYHSLHVAEPLPPSLAATAWAEDGVVMGLRHRHRPLWGVQFHPESISTEHGRELLVKFRDITLARRRAGHGRTGNGAAARTGTTGTARGAGPEDRAARSAAGDRRPAGTAGPPTRRYRLRVRVIDFEVDTDAAFRRLFGSSPYAFWLDSAHVEPGLARFSHLGDAVGPLAERVRYRVGDGRVSVSGADGHRDVPGTVFDYLRAELRRRTIEAPDLPFDFTCGYVGYLGYELKADCGSPARHRSANPDAQWIFADRAVTVDHERGQTYVLALDDGSPAGATAADDWLRAGTEALRTLPAGADDQPAQRITAELSAVEPWLVRDRDRYLRDIAAARDKLLAGESYEICLTDSVRLPDMGGGLPFYRELRRVNPAPYAAYLRFGGLEVACSSPERFLRIDRDRTVETKPIKGTAPRGATPEQDAWLREELATSPKTYAENLMIVDLLRNDLGRVCEVGSVRVPRLMAVESYATVHQLVSTIRGSLRTDLDAVDCVRACFPGGSMTGAPKLRTMEIIDGLETEARGIYSGAIGFLGCDGTADLNIVIRTAVLADGQWQVGAGGAIVLGSDPVEEYDEMLLKAAATLRAHPAVGTAAAGAGVVA
ncbi:aminodeoxychorismate synthase component I [Plantactinospora sp. KBS50]|uniref:aminodeoxychorismate synthase component I n=1 Tax=Plantactinospora sp. KBS50 TaxID=2024580 RepID=UPI000BAB117F|nr:aminodeoxychorismate synthase component I [Plantactinospora sp. KBS50]ASW56769.1 aminodeoxychorismate synthase, component I [Plantactinospora sp. KBS50]